MPWSEDKRFWVGRQGTHGIVVFDRKGNDGEVWVTVFYVEEDDFAVRRRSVMRDTTRDDGVSAKDARAALHACLTHAERQLERDNRAFLAKRGRKAAGVRRRSDDRPARATHCYACKHDLDNAVDFECVACGWILCRCGACGCGYSPDGP